MKRSLLMLTILSASLLVSACHTMSGAGEDISAGGKKLEKSADHNTTY